MANTKNKIIVFDIDGTLANIEHRSHHVKNGRRNWPAFNREMVRDTPHDDIVWLARLFSIAKDVTILIASGRGEEQREVTEDWIRVNLTHTFGIVPARIYMRPEKDFRKDSIIKKEILEEIRKDFGEPFMVFDDRQQVVDMWRENGIRCLQVAPGDF